MTITVSREELYKKVWETPMNQIAKDYGLSSAKLKGICERHDIPTPPAGHWGKLEFGKAVVVRPLPPLKPGVSDTISISPVPAPKTPVELSPPEPVKPAFITQASKKEPSAKADTSRPHPVVKRWLDNKRDAIRQAKREKALGYITFMESPFTEMEERRMKVLDMIFKAIDKKGFSITPSDSGYLFSVHYEGIPLEFTVTEKYKLVKTPLTKIEKAKAWNRDRQYNQEKAYTGFLQFTIKSSIASGHKSYWLEDADTRLEDLVPEIASALMACGPKLVERKRENEERTRQYLQQQQEIRMKAQREKEDKQNWSNFLKLAMKSIEASHLRVFIEQLELRSATEGPECNVRGQPIGEWLDWAKAWVERHDPLNGTVEQIFNDVCSTREL
jgi:hypothetical protein